MNVIYGMTSRTLNEQQKNLHEKFQRSKPERTRFYKSQMKVRWIQFWNVVVYESKKIFFRTAKSTGALYFEFPVGRIGQFVSAWISETWHMTYYLLFIDTYRINIRSKWFDMIMTVVQLFTCLLLTRLCVGGAASDQFYVLLSWVIKYSNILNIHPCVTWPECPPDLHHGGRYRPGSVSPQVTLGQYCGNLGHTMHPPPTPTSLS